MILPALLLAQIIPPANAPETCPPVPPALPAALRDWGRPGVDLSSGRAVTVASIDPKTVRLADVPAPERPGRMILRTIKVSRPGTYGIALDQKGWIDLYRAGNRTALVSTKHGHGPDCSGIRKIVRYALTPGEYRVMVTGLDKPRATMMLVSGE